MIQSVRALTDAGFIVDTARNGFIGLNKMLSSTFPNTPTCFSTAPIPAPAPAPAPAAVTVAVAVAVTAIADPKSIALEIISNESCSKNKNTNTNTNDDISQGVESNGKTTGAGTGTGTGMGSKHLVVDTTSVSVEGTTVAEVSPEVIKPFDYVLMDIQMPVMGKGSSINCLLCYGINISFYIMSCHVMSCHVILCHVMS